MKWYEKIYISFTIILAIAILVYAANEAPSEFGDDTITTVWIGGHSGVLNVTGKVFLSNYSVNISDGQVNASTFHGEYRNESGALDWITCTNVLDIDKECIESDLNTWVDIAGDNMTGDLHIGSNWNISSLDGSANMTNIGLVNVSNLTISNSAWGISYNGSCVIIRSGDTEGRFCK